MLVACFAIKLFGGNWFEIVCTNEHFSLFCDFVDKKPIIQHIIAFVVYFVSTFLIMISSSRQTNPKTNQKVFLFISISLIWFSKFSSMYLKTILEMSFFLFCPFLLNFAIKRKKAKRKDFFKEILFGVFGIFLTWCFQIISLVVKNIGVSFVGNDTFLALILMIDYYIMIVLYYLYTKEVAKDGYVGSLPVQSGNRST
jgi:hypothetical protein